MKRTCVKPPLQQMQQGHFLIVTFRWSSLTTYKASQKDLNENAVLEISVTSIIMSKPQVQFDMEICKCHNEHKLIFKQIKCPQMAAALAK